MSSEYPSPDGTPRSSRQHASAAAAEWFLKYGEGLSRSERIEFVRWLRESPQNVAEYLRVASTAGALSGIRKWPELPPVSREELASGSADENVEWLAGREIGRRIPGRAAASPKSARRGTWASAGTLAAMLAIAAWSVLWWRGAIGGAVYVAGPGELRSLKLEDGSEISLTSETRLRVDFDADVREIFLSRGEALFHVAKDARRPFVVRADRTSARAVGTAFSVQRDAKHVVVTVGEGRVAVSQAEGVLPFRGAPAADEGVALAADQQIATAPDGQLQQVRFVDSQRALAWAKGDLIFENETVDAVVAKFNRFARIKMRVEDRYIGSRTVSGIFEVDDPESFVAFLSSVEQVTVARPRADEIVIGKAGSNGPGDGQIH